MLYRAALLIAGVVPMFAFADNVLHPGTAVFDRPTLTALGVQLPLSGDDNFNATVDVRYRKTGTTVWKTAQPLFRVHPETTLPYVVAPQFGGSIIDLRPGTSYDVELHIKDPDGPVDQTVTMTATTRTVPGDPVSPHNVVVTDTDSLNRALDAAQAGDVITLANGLYSGQFAIYRGGTAANPIVIRGASQDGVILDGGDCIDCNIIEAYGSFIHIERLTVQNGQRAIRFQTAGAQGCVLRYVHIKNTNLALGSKPNQVDFYIADNIVEGRITWPHVYWDDEGAHSDDDGLRVEGSGHVIAHNRISGYGDAMKTVQTGSRANDFYGNDILFSYDNGVELDESQGNVRLLRNRFSNTFDTISAQPILGGPAYVVRNESFNTVSEQVKLHAHANPLTEPNGAFVYNNTFVSYQFALNMQSTVSVHHFAFQNNLFIGPPDNYEHDTVDWYSYIDDGIFDYNGYWPNNYFSYLTKAGILKVYQLAALQQHGMEVHGVIVGDATAPRAFAGGQSAPLDYSIKVQPQDLSLASGSAAVDHALLLANINDGFKGAAPDLGARELGCPAPIHGPRPVGMDETNEPFGCDGGTVITVPDPVVTITAPAAAASVKGTNISLGATATASNGRTISVVQFQVNGKFVATGVAGAAGTYTATFDSTSFPNGLATVVALATDSAGATGTSPGVSITINNDVIVQPPPPPSALITAFVAAPPRNNAGGWWGLRFTVGNAPMTVSALGRVYVPGNTGTHIVKLVKTTDGSDFPGGSVTITLPGTQQDGFVYGTLPSAVTLPANTSYYLMSQEFWNGDQWRDFAGVTATSAATIDGAAYWDGANWATAPVPSTSYVPVNLIIGAGTGPGPNPPSVAITAPGPGSPVSGNNVALVATATAAGNATITSVQFKLNGNTVVAGTPVAANIYAGALNSTSFTDGTYALTATATDSKGNSATSAPVSIIIQNTTPPPPPPPDGTPFLTTLSSSSPRKDFAGWVGMQLTVGASPISVTALGRIYLPGNSSPHVVKFIKVSDGTDVPGGSATVTPSGTPNAITYVKLPAAVTLAANTSYYLVSAETLFGDEWRDIGGVSSTSVATINGATYFWTALNKWINSAVPGTTFGPVSFLYGAGAPPAGPPVVSITSPGPNSSFTTPFTVTATATAATGLTIGKVQFNVDGVNVAAGTPGGSNTYTASIDATKYATGGHSLTAVATDSANVSTTSTPVAFTVSTVSTGNPPSPLLISYGGGVYRNDYSGWVGMQFTILGAPIQVTALGRMYIQTNSAVHVLRLVRVSDGADVASVSVTPSIGTVGAFTYANLPTPVTLVPNTPYYLVSSEVADGDWWRDIVSVTPTDAAIVNFPIYWDGVKWVPIQNAGSTFVPVNLLYTSGTGGSVTPPPTVSLTAPSLNATISGKTVSVGAIATAAAGATITSVQFNIDGGLLAAGTPGPSNSYTAILDSTKYSNGIHTITAVATDSAGGTTTSSAVTVTVSNVVATGSPFVLGLQKGAQRNDYSGWVGYKILVGPNPLTVTSVGRIYIAGNSGTHTVKFVLASTGADVPGGSAMVSVASGTPDTFRYAALPAPITLAANTAYFIVSQETNGGDQWLDISPLTTTSVAAVNGTAFWDGSRYVVLPLVGGGYVPVSFLYQ